MARFNSYLDNLNLTEIADFFREKGCACHYKKEDIFIQQGTVARYAALVLSGYFKLTTSNHDLKNIRQGFIDRFEHVAMSMCIQVGKKKICGRKRHSSL